MLRLSWQLMWNTKTCSQCTQRHVQALWRRCFFGWLGLYLLINDWCVLIFPFTFLFRPNWSPGRFFPRCRFPGSAGGQRSTSLLHPGKWGAWLVWAWPWGYSVKLYSNRISSLQISAGWNHWNHRISRREKTRGGACGYKITILVPFGPRGVLTPRILWQRL